MTGLMGCFSLVLHTHMPYVLRNGAFPVGEDWLYQVMSDTYLPLIEMLRRLEADGCSNCLSLTLTPVLCEQLADSYTAEKFTAYLEEMAGHAAEDERDFVYFDDGARLELAETYRSNYERQLELFRELDGDILGALRSLEGAGTIETIASSATHAFLPALDQRSIEYQVRIGIESHREKLGRQPGGFWLPECAYLREVEELLEAGGVRYILLDSTALEPAPPNVPVMVGDSDVAAFARSEAAHARVWDEVSGYPADPVYRDSTRYYQNSGLRYWRVTGRTVPIEEKAVYEPGPARARAAEHATSFLGEVTSELERGDGGQGQAPIVLASYDTELFGHGWHEGFTWMDSLLRSMVADGKVEPVTPSRYLEKNQPVTRFAPLETTWGTGRDDSTWINEKTAWMWREIASAQESLSRVMERRLRGDLPPEAERTARQAAREVLLLESSDWPYMVAKDRASNYATERFNSHLERFRELVRALESGEVGAKMGLVSGVEEVDRLFSSLDLDVFS